MNKDINLPPLFLQYGMKRSGNHAIAGWLLEKMPCAFVNNLVPIGPVLQEGRPYPNAQDFQKWKAQQESAKSYYVTLEDIELDYTPFHGLASVQKILILRHPDNMFSSRIKKALNVNMTAYPKDNSAIMQRAVKIWKQHARCFLGMEATATARLAIYFDVWLNDRTYRDAICDAFGLAQDNHEQSAMTDHGGGSSFDGLIFQENPKEMDLLGRAKLLNPVEKALLDEINTDEELTQLKIALTLVNPLDHLITR